MRRLFVVLATASMLSACASSHPTCDGNSRRPINVPMHAEIAYPSCGSSV